jgi:hypothetical protein
LGDIWVRQRRDVSGTSVKFRGLLQLLTLFSKLSEFNDGPHSLGVEFNRSFQRDLSFCVPSGGGQRGAKDAVCRHIARFHLDCCRCRSDRAFIIGIEEIDQRPQNPGLDRLGPEHPRSSSMIGRRAEIAFA